MNSANKPLFKTIPYLFILVQASFGMRATTSQTYALNKPGLSVTWNSDTTNYAKLVIVDSSTNATGYRIYRANGFSSSFTLISLLAGTNLAKNDTTIWLDSAITLNSWINYKVAVFSGTDSLFSDPCSTYSFHSEQTQQPVTFTKLSDFPISMDSGLSALSGDSLILKESNSPAGKHSAINVKDPVNPKNAGYVDSTTLLSYPTKTLVPVFLKYGVVNSFASKKVCSYNDKILVLRDSVLRRYQIQNNSLVLIDSLKSFKGNSILLLGDTATLAVQYTQGFGVGFDCYFYPIQIFHSGFSVLPEYWLGSEIRLTAGNLIQTNIQGVFDSKIIISANNIRYGVISNGESTDAIIYDISLKHAIRLPQVSSLLNSTNTGNYISAAENLTTSITDEESILPAGYSTNFTELFISDIRNLHSYEFALSHNGLYRDTVHTKDQLKNILLDTAGKKVYLVFSTNLTILSYQRTISGVKDFTTRTAPSRGITICPNVFGTTIVLPDNCRNADLFIYDLSGRIVERMRNIASNAILFRPKSKSSNCYVAVVKNSGGQYSAKFVTR